MRLLERSTRRTIRNIRARKFEHPPAVVTAARVKFSGVIRERKQMLRKQFIKKR
jgi:hypothetical protein